MPARRGECGLERVNEKNRHCICAFFWEGVGWFGVGERGEGGGRIGCERWGGKRERERVGTCRVRGAFWGPELKPSDTCCKLEVTRGHCACVRALFADIKLADLEITVEA